MSNVEKDVDLIKCIFMKGKFIMRRFAMRIINIWYLQSQIVSPQGTRSILNHFFLAKNDVPSRVKAWIITDISS